jgi:hypothetical protein
LRQVRLNQLPVFLAPLAVASPTSSALSPTSLTPFFAPRAATFAPLAVASPTSSALSAASLPTVFPDVTA